MKKKQNLIAECNKLINDIKKLDSAYNKTVNENDDVEKLKVFKTELENELKNLTNKQKCKELEKEIQKINPEFKMQTISNEKPEDIDKIKNELEKKLDFLDPNRKLKDKEKKPEEKKLEEKKYFSGKLIVKDIMNKIYNFIQTSRKNGIDSVKGKDLDDCTEKVKVQLAEYKKKLEGIKSSLKDLDYEKAQNFYKETSEMKLDFEVADDLTHYQQEGVSKLLSKTNKDFWAGSRYNVEALNGICKAICDECDKVIKKHDEEELKKKIEKENFQNWLSELSWSLPGDFKCTSEGNSVFIVKDGVKYGTYSYDGFWLDKFDFFIKRSDLINYIRDADKLEFNDKDFKKDRILIAFKFWTINTIDSQVIKILLDLKSKKIFVYDNKEVYFVGEDCWMSLCKGDPYKAEKDDAKYYKSNHSRFFAHIESNKFNFRYRNNY